jgi:membrane-anchored glycerophosphoryl diester phosphodiesterase (GDPDase)
MTERGSNIAGVIEALKSQPLMLGLLLVIFALIGLLYFQSSSFTTQRRENVALFIDVQKEVQKLLSQCIVPPPITR